LVLFDRFIESVDWYALCIELVNEYLKSVRGPTGRYVVMFTNRVHISSEFC